VFNTLRKAQVLVEKWRRFVTKRVVSTNTVAVGGTVAPLATDEA
jgi:hypothetical protein